MGSRFVVAGLAALVAAGVVLALGVAGGFVLLVVLNGFSERAALPYIVGYAIGVLVVATLAGSAASAAVLRRGGTAASFAQAAVVGGGMTFLCVGVVGLMLMLRHPGRDGRDAHGCREGETYVRRGSNFYCGVACSDDADCKKGWRCIAWGQSVDDSGALGSEVDLCRPR